MGESAKRQKLEEYRSAPEAPRGSSGGSQGTLAGAKAGPGGPAAGTERTDHKDNDSAYFFSRAPEAARGRSPGCTPSPPSVRPFRTRWRCRMTIMRAPVSGACGRPCRGRPWHRLISPPPSGRPSASRRDAIIFASGIPDGDTGTSANVRFCRFPDSPIHRSIVRTGTSALQALLAICGRVINQPQLRKKRIAESAPQSEKQPKLPLANYCRDRAVFMAGSLIRPRCCQPADAGCRRCPGR